ncbi:hypothetical protein HMPREF1219_00119 [Corynebacterium pyruviciproducens ATCC BAA-1742]|uniref:HTH cro/C1-type domain-containing protein n=2 Tax=Corynebacterium pyruviciproducens TaxID=598660 RepID=S3A3P4_9CORY|nr:hypothetical protein HMPREF1219_00119 [Corynebacterium pyruviciproducens ATCC BAA-1742]
MCHIGTGGKFWYTEGMKESHTQWLRRITRGDSNRQICDLAHLAPSTLGRQIREGRLDPAIIIKVAQAYEESPVIALVDLGYISARWITEPGIATALSRATDEELTNELLRRLQLLPDEPVDELVEQRRSNKPSSALPDDGVVRDWDDSIPHAADSSPDEDLLREEEGEGPID